MKRYMKITCAMAILIHISASELYPHSGPFDGKNFKGRIALSSDGNYNDEDDWGAFPVEVAMLDAFGVKDKLVHVDYCNILVKNDARFYREMTESVLGAADRYSIPRSILFDCQKDLDGAIESIKNAVNASSADDPLYFVLAGPMEVPFRGIRKSDPDKRKHVYCISHSGWNDGYTREDQHLHNYDKRDVILSGINWVQCRSGRGLSHPGSVGRESTPEQWSLFTWLKNSRDRRLNWIFTRLQAEKRCDVSDSTMTYFLLTGDEGADPAKLKSLLDDKRIPAPIDPRKEVRIEAENFLVLENYAVEHRNDRSASHRLSVRLAGSGAGRIHTPFDQPYTAHSARYDVEVRYFDEEDGRCRFGLYVNGVQKGAAFSASADTDSWQSETIVDVPISTGDEIMVAVQGNGGEYGKLDYVQLNYRAQASGASGSAKSRFSASGPLDDPDALPGQVIVAGPKPGYLKYNGGGPVFICGPDNPETFLWDGTLNADGTRSGGKQEAIIERMAAAGLNGFHFQMFRMQRCNFKDEGDDKHAPFIDHDPAKGLDEDVLKQWDGWLGLLEDKGIIVHLEFYNDATDVEMMGWTLDANGNLHRHERRWIEGIVNKFKHHKNILWGIEESVNKLPPSRTPHFKKIAELIAQTDNHNHPIVQSFVVPIDMEGDFPVGGARADVYADDENIDVVTWLHVVPHGEDYEKQHQEYLQFYENDSHNFIMLKNETYHHPRGGQRCRRYMWSCAMTGTHTLEAYIGADRASEDTLADVGRINTFMEQTEFYKMNPRDDLAAGSTKWVLANPGDCYIAYTYDYSDSMGVKSMVAGTYDLMWFDTLDGNVVKQSDVSVPWGDVIWSKPASMSNELVLYIKRQASSSSSSGFSASGPLDDPDAQPGQIIAASKNSAYLKYNGGGPAFLCGPEKVQRWDVHKATLTASQSYANPFQDVSLTATFTHESSGDRLTVDGFHDGGDTWRFRFMPTQVGTWCWSTKSNDGGLDGNTGSLECVSPAKPYLHGPLKVQGLHFVHVDGTPRFLISTRLTCQFAPPSTWPALIAFLKENRINRVLFMIPGVDSKKDPVYTQRILFAPGLDYTRYNVEAFRAIDEFIDTLRQADILASPYFFYDPRREVMWTMRPEQDRAYVRYGMARLGAFSNVMPVLANEVELKTTNYKDPAFDLKSHAWANEMGAFLKSRVVFGQPVSVHNPCWHEFAVNPSYFTLLKDWPFAGWADFMLKQIQMGSIGTASAMTDDVPQPRKPTYNERTYARRNQVLIDLRRFGQPVIDEEPGYDMGGTRSAWNSQTPERMRPTFWTAATAGAYTTWGSLSVYVTGDPLPKMKGSATPQYLRVLHDVMAELPYQEMAPHNECVFPANVTLDGESWRTNFALAKPGKAYLVYSLGGGTGTVTLAPGRYSAVRVDPRNGRQTELGSVAGGAVGFSLPQGDWVLVYRRTAAGDVSWTKPASMSKELALYVKRIGE